MLTRQEQEAVIIAAYQMRQAREKADGTALEIKYQAMELLKEFGVLWPVFSFYLCLLQADSELFHPLDIYAAGKGAYAPGADCESCLVSYIIGTIGSTKAKTIQGAMQRCFELGCKITRKKGLLREFHTLYQALSGTWNETVKVFFYAGFHDAKYKNTFFI